MRLMKKIAIFLFGVTLSFACVEAKSSDKMKPTEKKSIVAIESGAGGGTGFVAQINGRKFLVSNSHVIGAMKSPKISTLSGDELKLGRLFAAHSHDIAIVEIIDAPESIEPLKIMDEVEMNVAIKDKIVVCGNSRAKGTILDTYGEVVGIGAKKVETSAPFYEGNSGSPIFHFKSRKVIGVASYVSIESKKSSAVSEVSRDNKNSAIKRDARYFAYRLDSIKKWDSISFTELFSQNEKIVNYDKKLRTIYKTYGKIASDKNIDTSLTDYKEYRDIVQEYKRDSMPTRSQSSRRRAKYDFYENMKKLCDMELQKIKTVKTISTFDERKGHLISAYTHLRDFFDKAMRE